MAGRSMMSLDEHWFSICVSILPIAIGSFTSD